MGLDLIKPCFVAPVLGFFFGCIIYVGDAKAAKPLMTAEEDPAQCGCDRISGRRPRSPPSLAQTTVAPADDIVVVSKAADEEPMPRWPPTTRAGAASTCRPPAKPLTMDH